MRPDVQRDADAILLLDHSLLPTAVAAGWPHMHACPQGPGQLDYLVASLAADWWRSLPPQEQQRQVRVHVAAAG